VILKNRSMSPLETAPVILKANGPADVLAMIPSIAGFEPRDSLILLAFRGKRSCAAIRFDLPASHSATVLKRFATFAVGTVCKLPGVDAVVAAIYANEPVGSSNRLPHADYAEVVGRRLRQSGFELRQLLCQAEDAWGSYLDTRLPIGGHSLVEIFESPLLADVPKELNSRRDLDGPDRIPDADTSVRARFASQLAEQRSALDNFRAASEAANPANEENDESVPDRLVPWSNLPEFFEQALEWDDQRIEQQGATLLLVIQAPPMRDAAMLQWASDIRIGEISLEQSAQVNEGTWRAGDTATPMEAAIEQLLGNLMLGIGPRPDPKRVEGGITLLLLLVSLAEDADRPAPLCMLAWLSWALGRGTEAGRFIDEVRTIDPHYGMGELLDAMFSNAMMPEWAFQDQEELER
jgi:Domain of unknown function (DUF4192)